MNGEEKKAGELLACGAVRYILENGDELAQVQLVSTLLLCQSRLGEKLKDEAEQKRCKEEQYTQQVNQQMQRDQAQYQPVMQRCGGLWNHQEEPEKGN